MRESNTQRENLEMNVSGAPSKVLYTIFAISAILGITGWIFLLSIYIFWTLEPVNLTNVKEPIPVLNENHMVAIGDTLKMELIISKPEDIAPNDAARYLECESGNLVTLTATAINLPVGTYTITSNDVVIPVKVTPDDVCVYVMQVTYNINPLKQVTNRFTSEKFIIIPAKE